MVVLIPPDRHHEFADELNGMHRLRFRVFHERLAWSVEVKGESEADRFDCCRPIWLLLHGPAGQIAGCVRLLPSEGPTMLRDVFSGLLEGREAPAQSDVWESSRFALDFPGHAPAGAGGVAMPTYELLAAMLEFGVSRKLTKIVTVTDVRMERILRRAQWPLERLGLARSLGRTMAVAGFLPVSREVLARVRHAGNLRHSVLWQPVL